MEAANRVRSSSSFASGEPLETSDHEVVVLPLLGRLPTEEGEALLPIQKYSLSEPSVASNSHNRCYYRRSGPTALCAQCSHAHARRARPYT